MARAGAYVSVIGGSGIAPDSGEAMLAREVGRLIAARGAVLVCGGMYGVIEGASRDGGRGGRRRSVRGAGLSAPPAFALIRPWGGSANAGVVGR